MADGFVTGGNGTDSGNVIRAIDSLRVGLNGLHSSLHAPLNALAHHHGVGAGGYVLQTLTDNGLSQYGGGGGTVAGHIVGLGCHFTDQLCAHILKSVLQLHILGDGNTVIGDEGRAELLAQNHIPALGTQGDLHGVSQLVDASLQILASFLAVNNHF